VRPIRIGHAAPAFAKARAVARPMPLPAPVMMTVLPIWLRLGFDGSMAAWDSLCQVAVGDGNGGCIVTGKWTARDVLRKEAGVGTFGRLCVGKSVERVVWGRNCDILKICSTVQGMNSYKVNVFSDKLTVDVPHVVWCIASVERATRASTG